MRYDHGVMTTCTFDMRAGTRTFYLDLREHHFRSRLGNEGTVAIACDGASRAVDAVLELRVPTAHAVEELPRLAALADWTMPDANVATMAARHVQVIFNLRELWRAELAGTDLACEDWDAFFGAHAYLLDHNSYDLADISDR